MVFTGLVLDRFWTPKEPKNLGTTPKRRAKPRHQTLSTNLFKQSLAAHQKSITQNSGHSPKEEQNLNTKPNPKHRTLNPRAQTSNFKHPTLETRPETSNPKSLTPKNKSIKVKFWPSILDPQGHLIEV
jgi:hypothetical protein